MTTPDEIFRAAAVEGWLHARDLDSGAEVDAGGDTPVVLASVFKIAVLVEVLAQADVGVLDLAAPVAVPAAGRTFGPFGLSVMRDAAVLSLRDLAWLMMSISDNAATDVVCDAVGVRAVNERLEAFGLNRTRLVGACRDLIRSMEEDAGPDVPIEEALTDPDRVARMRAVDPVRTTRSTPRETTALLELIWSDRAASPDACAEARRILGQQVWPHRLASGFPEDDVRTSGKTGTLPRWRNEAGVVEYPDGGRYAVAVFTRASSPRLKHPAADAAIGSSARWAVDRLRRAR